MKSQTGYVLISVLFFLTVLYVLATGLLETTLLETKMSANYAEQTDNLYTTEQTLVGYEQKILNGSPPSNAKKIEPAIDSAICGIAYYRVTASHTHGMNSTVLESTFAKIEDTIKMQS